jgi:hypothetical protein
VKKLLRDGDSAALGALREYFETFADNLDRFKIEPERDRPSPGEVLESIENLLPYRDEAVEVFVSLSKYWPSEEGSHVLHEFFERLLPYTIGDHPAHTHDTSVDNFAFVIRELFLYAIAALLKYQRFEAVNLLLKRKYYLEGDQPAVQSGTRTFATFRTYIRSLEDDMNHDRINKTADVLKDRADREDIPFKAVMQAAFLLYLRGEADQLRGRETGRSHGWYPDALLYAGRGTGPFEFFARASDGSSEGLQIALGLSGWDDFVSLLQEIQEKGGYPRIGRFPLRVSKLVSSE